MTPEQVTLIQQSFSKVAPISEQAAVMFYDRLFEVAPSVRAMFPEDMTEQRKKLTEQQMQPAMGGRKLNDWQKTRRLQKTKSIWMITNGISHDFRANAWVCRPQT